MPLVCRYINIIKNLMGLNRFEICFVGFLKADTFLENQAENLHSNLKKQSIFVRRNGCQLVAHCNLRLFKKKKKTLGLAWFWKEFALQTPSECLALEMF